MASAPFWDGCFSACVCPRPAAQTRRRCPSPSLRVTFVRLVMVRVNVFGVRGTCGARHGRVALMLPCGVPEQDRRRRRPPFPRRRPPVGHGLLHGAGGGRGSDACEEQVVNVVNVARVQIILGDQ
jgi:hypothetical protein